jgi:hypothetical protein
MNFPLSIISMAIANIPAYAAALLSTQADILRSHGRYTKVKFTPTEDARLLDLVQQLGTQDWAAISSMMQTRNPRQCRERYKNYLNPELRNDSWTTEEDTLLESKCDELGPKWSRIARFFQNRSDNALRNRWMMLNRHRSKDLDASTSIDDSPPTSERRTDISDSTAKFDSVLGVENHESCFDPWGNFYF